MDNIAEIDLGPTSYLDRDQLTSLSKEMIHALSTTGLCYIKNHGVDETLITRFLEASKTMFQQSKETPEDETGPDGCMTLGGEALNPERPPDLKEVFKYRPAKEAHIKWPDSSFKDVLKMFSAFADLSYKVLEVLSYGLDLSVDFFKKVHSLIGQTGNRTTLRAHYYPPLSGNTAPVANQIRCGEHTDFGTITFLVLDEVGGFEALIPEKGFVPVKPIPGSIIVMVGCLIQRWTSDRLSAPKHRVDIPTDISKRSTCRQSVAYFVNPDDETVVRCLDGKDKYNPVKAVDYIKHRKGNI